jgi:hypothetical protein
MFLLILGADWDKACSLKKKQNQWHFVEKISAFLFVF